MIVEQLGELVDAAAFELETHQGGDALDFVEGVEGVGLVADVSADDVPQQVSGEPPLARVDQCKAFLQFFLRGFREDDMLDIELLVDARQGGDVFDAFRDAADLVLPAAAR